MNKLCLGLLLGAGLLLAGCGAAARPDELLIGVLLPATGPEAYYGQDMLNGYQLAVDELNAAGGLAGRTLRLYPQDDASDPAQAVTAAARIVSAGCQAVIGGYSSGATIPALRQFADAGLVFLITAANSTAITELGVEQAFMLNAPAPYEAALLLDLGEELGISRLAVIHQGDDYSQNLAEHTLAQAAGGGLEVVTVQVLEKNTADVSAIVTAVIYADAELVFWCGYHADGANLIKQLRRGGYQGPVACGDGSAAAGLIEGAGPAGDEVYVICPPAAEYLPEGAAFIASYSRAFHREPGVYAALSYDTVYLLAAAVARAASWEGGALAVALGGLTYQGLTGEISFNSRRELDRCNLILMQADYERGCFVPAPAPEGGGLP